MKVDLAEYSLFVYSNAMVICEKVEFAEGRHGVVKNPVLTVEVLPDSTVSYNRSQKFKK